MQETNDPVSDNIWSNSDFKDIADLMKWVGDSADEYRGIRQSPITEDIVSNPWKDCAELREIATIMNEVARSATERYHELEAKRKINESNNKDQSK